MRRSAPSRKIRRGSDAVSEQDAKDGALNEGTVWELEFDVLLSRFPRPDQLAPKKSLQHQRHYNTEKYTPRVSEYQGRGWYNLNMFCGVRP